MNPLQKLWRSVFGDGDGGSEAGPPDANQSVLLGMPGDPATAAFWQDMLKRENIRCMLRDGGSLGGLTGMDTPQIEIYVLEQDLERARSVVGVEEAPAD